MSVYETLGGPLARIEEGERVPAVRCNVNRQSHAAQPAA